MVHICDIRETRRGRFALFSGDGFLFSIDGETLLRAGLEIGARLREEDLARLRDASDIRKAKDTALRYLSLRAYGERELYAKLAQKYDEHTCAAVVAQMCELELLCDGTFAMEKAKGMAQRGKTAVEIRQKLAALGIDRDLADSALAGLDMDGAEMAFQLVEKKYLDVLRAGGRQKVMAALARRGFAYRDITAALERAGQLWESEEPDET